MIGHLILFLESLVLKFGTLGIFIASFIEEFFAPIPSGIVILTAGYGLLGTTPITLGNLAYLYVWVAIPIACGLTIGSLVWYFLAYIYGEPAIRKWGKYVFISWSEIEKVRHKYEKRHKSEYGLFLLRSVPILPSIVINLIAGLLKVKLFPYVIATFLGTTIRASIIGFVGWQVGEVYRTYAHVIDKFEKIILALISITIIVWIAYMKRKKS